jgi:hypothetical protein
MNPFRNTKILFFAFTLVLSAACNSVETQKNKIEKEEIENKIKVAENNLEVKWSDFIANCERGRALLTVAYSQVKNKKIPVSSELASQLESTIDHKVDNIDFKSLDDQTFNRIVSDQNTILAAETDLHDAIATNKEFSDIVGQMEGMENRIIVSVADYNIAVKNYNALDKEHPVSYEIKLNRPEVKVNFSIK